MPKTYYTPRKLPPEQPDRRDITIRYTPDFSNPFAFMG